MPTASIRPIIDRILRVRPKKYSAPSVISNENGTEAVTISVVDTWRRKRYSTTRASRPPTSPALSRSESESAVVAIGGAQLDVSDITQPQAGFVDHEVANLLDRVEFAPRPDAEALVARRDSTGIDREIAALQEVA